MGWNFDQDNDDDQSTFKRIEPPRSGQARGAAGRSKRIRTKRRGNSVNGIQRRRAKRPQW